MPARRGILVEARERPLRLTIGFFDAYPPRKVSIGRPAPTLRRGILVALIVAGAFVPARTASAQAFGVGGGGSLAADLGSDVVDNSFKNWGGFVFGELSLGRPEVRQDGVFQLRLSYTSLPGGAQDAPSLDVWSGLGLVYYRFRDTWWEVGFFGGVGLFRVLPKSLLPGQVPADPTQTVVGFAFGTQTVFRVSRRFDLRLEVFGEYLNTRYRHVPIFLTTAVGYSF